MAKVILVAELEYPSTMVITNNNQLYVQTEGNIVHINNKHIEAFIGGASLIGTDGQDIYSISHGQDKKYRVISTKPNKESIIQYGLTSWLSKKLYIQVERNGTYFLSNDSLLRYVVDERPIDVAYWGKEELDDPPYRWVSGYLVGDYTVYKVVNGSLITYDNFDEIAAIALDTKGNLYICETSRRIYRVDPRGKYTHFDLTGSAIGSISNMVVDNYGIIYISSEQEGKIYKIIPPYVKILPKFILRNDPRRPGFKLFLTDT